MDPQSNQAPGFRSGGPVEAPAKDDRPLRTGPAAGSAAYVSEHFKNFMEPAKLDFSASSLPSLESTDSSERPSTFSVLSDMGSSEQFYPSLLNGNSTDADFLKHVIELEKFRLSELFIPYEFQSIQYPGPVKARMDMADLSETKTSDAQSKGMLVASHY